MVRFFIGIYYIVYFVLDKGASCKGAKKSNSNYDKDKKSQFSRDKKFNGECNHCGKYGHMENAASQRREKKRELMFPMMENNNKKKWF